MINGRPLRQARSLPLARDKDERKDYYYEGQISLLVCGPDEWRWTSYCLVDTYFGCEDSWQSYLKHNPPMEPATGGSQPLELSTLWNPREYFLTVLGRRLRQATSESIALFDALLDRLNTEVNLNFIPNFKRMLISS
jgi:hypothetical protein